MVIERHVLTEHVYSKRLNLMIDDFTVQLKKHLKSSTFGIPYEFHKCWLESIRGTVSFLVYRHFKIYKTFDSSTYFN